MQECFIIMQSTGRAAAGTIYAKGPSAALKIDFCGKAGRAS